MKGVSNTATPQIYPAINPKMVTLRYSVTKQMLSMAVHLTKKLLLAVDMS